MINLFDIFSSISDFIYFRPEYYSGLFLPLIIFSSLGVSLLLIRRNRKEKEWQNVKP